MLTVSGSSFASWITAKACAANASFNSVCSISDKSNPACFRAFGIATQGPIPIYRGSTPPTAQDTSLAMGSSFNSLTIDSLTINVNAAPSEV